MSTKKIIVSPHYNRPEYTEQFLRYLENAIGIKEYHTVFYIEPLNQQVIDLIEKSKLSKTIVINPYVYGANANKVAAHIHGFELGDTVITLEEDILIARDGLQYFEWAFNKYIYDESILTVTGYNREPQMPSPDRYYVTGIRKWYHPWGEGMWRRSWNYVTQRGWNGDDQILLRYDLNEVYPILSRVQNIGIKNGCNSDGSPEMEEFYRKWHYLQHWAGNIDNLPVGQFHE